MKFLAVSSIAVLFAAQQVAAYPFIAGCLQNHTITAADSCVSVAAQYQITEAEFYAMNPGLHHSVQHNCDNLDSGKNYCVCLKAPCPVANNAAVSVAPAASGATNATVSASAAVSSSIAPLSSSALPTSSVLVKPSAASTVPSASASASTTNSSTTKSSATVTTTISAITIGLVMTATTLLL